MADQVSTEQLADTMFKMIKDAAGMKKYKAGDLIKAMIEIHVDKVDKKACKGAIKELINSGRCIYTYFGGSFIEIPHTEGAANE